MIYYLNGGIRMEYRELLPYRISAAYAPDTQKRGIGTQKIRAIPKRPHSLY